MKKLRSLVAAVVAAACLYTPTAAADPLSVELNALDSTIQVDGMAGNQPDGDAADGDQPDDNGVVESDGGALTSGSGEPTVESEGADTVPEGADATPGEGDGAADDGPTADTPQAVDWTNAVDNLRLSTQGLTITSSVPADGETDADIAGTSVIPEGLNGSGVSRGAALGGLAESQPEQQAKEGAAQLPDAIDATLNLTFTLDAAAGDGRTDGSGLGTIVAGDHFSVPMPEGLATADEGSALDVFARDTDGSTTTVRVAEAKASDGVLTVTFTEPADAQAREAVTASIDVPVTLDAALVQDEVSTIEWTVRTMEDAEGNRQPETLTLNVPAKSDVMKMLGLTVVEPETEAEDEETDDSEDKQGEDAEHGTEDESAANDLTATAEPLALPATEETYALGSMNGTPQYPYQIVWCDNNSGVRPEISALQNGYILQYSLDGGKTFKNLTDTNDGTLTADAKEDFHLSSNTVDWSKVNVEQTATNTWTLTNASGLPTNVNVTTTSPVDADGDGEQDFNADGTPAWNTTTKSVYPQDIVWQIAATNATASEPTTGQGYYVKGANDSTLVGEGNNAVFTRYFMLTAPVSFTIVGKLGGNSLTEIFQNTGNEYFRLSASIDNKPVEDGNGVRFDTLEELLTGKDYADYQMRFTYDKATNTATVTGNMPAYDQNGVPIVYYVHYEGPQTGQDYYQVSYDNSQSANHGSANDCVYSGGTMTLRHAGTTSFTATKDWLDGASNAKHPETTFTLWRYTPTRNPDGYLTASQVQLSALRNADSRPAANSATEYVTITVPAGAEDNVDLGALLREAYGDEAINALPKYDPDGYPYVYCLREEGVPNGYEIVYGDYNAKTGEFTDTRPSYQGTVDEDDDGTFDWVEDVTERERPANNPFVYNNGTISNRRHDTVPTQVTKTWEIAAFQDQLQDVQVTLQAQSKRKYDPNDDWGNVEGEGATQTLTNWYAESLTQSVQQSFPKYDEAGYELEYRWIEANVALEGQTAEDIDFTMDPDTGKGSFKLTVPDAEGINETLEFSSESVVDPDTGATTITNSFVNETDETVVKLWEQPDGSYAQELPGKDAYEEASVAFNPETDFSGEVEVGLYQDGKLVDTFTLDGEADEQAASIDPEKLSIHENHQNDPTAQETEPYKLIFEHLPKYSNGGVRHTYLVLENQIAGWDMDRTYDAETRTTTITNSIGPGESSEIRISKQWIDGDDAAHRPDVVVQLVAKHDIRSQAEDENGQPLYSYKAGEVVPVWVDGENERQTDIQFGMSDRWYCEVEIPIGMLTADDFELREIALVDTKNTEDTSDDVTTHVVSYGQINAEDASATYPEYFDAEGNPQGWVDSGWDENSGTLRVATGQHVYEVTTTDEQGNQLYNEELDALEVTNRRLGIFDLTVSKHWSDSNASPKDRPDAELRMHSPEYPYAFSMDDDGNVWVSVSQNVLPVMDSEGKQLTRETATVKDGTLIVAVDKNQTDSTYTFFGLPKYDANGVMVHYEVEEHWVGDSGEYSSSTEVGDYQIGQQHYHDTQEVKIDNTRGNTRSVAFNKLWHDQYVNDELNQRPDIYLTLYRITRIVNADGTVTYEVPRYPEGDPNAGDMIPVDGFVHWLWEGTGEDEGEADASYSQQAVIEGLPKYDAEGNEYIYYASESMAANGEDLDYVDVAFSYDKMGTPVEGEDRALKVDAQATSEDPTLDGSGWAIHEDGTFENTLQSDLRAEGTKLWENVPGITDQGDLPEITVYLQRRLKAYGDVQAEDWPAMTGVSQDENGNWVFANGTVAQTSHLKMTANNNYSYLMTHEGINGENPDAEQGEKLQRYDEEGRPYEYRAIEVVWGLYGQPGGFTLTDKQLKTMNFADEELELMGKVITIQHGETGSFIIRNIYQSDQGNLTVKKFFTGRDEGDDYPSLTFDVYRYYNTTDDEGKTVPSASERVATKTFSGSDIEKLVGEDAQGNGSFEHTFTGLDIYAPDGSYWQYYVVERAINGYTTTVKVGNIADAGGVTDQDANTGAAADETIADIESPVLNPENGTPIKTGDYTPDVTFRNQYVPERAELNGTKTWDDFNNVFGVRPSTEEFKAGLKVERIGNGQTVDITDQLTNTDNPEADNYFWVSQDSSDNYLITVSGVPKWAPDGTAYQYKITETLSQMVLGESGKNAGDYYSTSNVDTPGTASSQISASNTDAHWNLRNGVEDEVSVIKNWEDGNDPYGLRPTSVTVRLQARVTYDDNSPDANGWADAYTLFNNAGYHLDGLVDQAGNQITESWFEKTLNAGNGWRGSWTGLPRGGKSKDPQKGYFTLEYRVVETKIGDQVIATPDEQPHATATDENKGNIYKTVHPYQPTQSDSGNAQDGFQSTITNTLEGTKITAEKRWSDVDNAWDTRPGGTNWAVTYLLQRRVPEDNWEWVTHYGTTHNEGENLFDPDIVTRTITSADATAEWDNLPATDTDGNAYSYRVVERVPGGYDVLQSENRSPQQVAEETILDGEHAVTYRYYAVDNDLVNGAFNDNQTYTNVLRTTELKGTKRWEDYGTGLADKLTVNDMPKLTLWRKAGDNGQAVQVTYIETTTNSDGTVIVDKNADGQPKWTKNGDDFTFTYTGLPAANGDDVRYTYWATETAGDAPGYYPLYGEGEELTSTPDESSVITNTATRFTLDKVSDDWYPATEGNQQVPVNDVELTLTKDDKTFAVWARNNRGVVSSTVWPDGATDTTQGGTKMTGNNAGYIIGLPAGTYTVTETKTPEGFAQARPVTITIAANGAVTASGDGFDSVDTVSGVADAAGTAVVKVTVEDQILRGHLQLTKYLSADGSAPGSLYSDATFDLYSVDLDKDGNPELIAAGLKPQDGVLTTVGNSIEIKKESSNPNNQVDLTHGGRYITLADGLPEGEYFFRETSVGPDAVKPGTSGTEVGVDSDHLTITQEHHYAFTNVPVATAKGNEVFNASVTLPKYDTTSTEGIENAEFELRYRPEGAEGTDYPVQVKAPDGSTTFKTDENGLLTLPDLEKGHYQLVETANPGYAVPADGRIIATFILDDADDDKTFDMTQSADREAVSFTAYNENFDVEGSYNNGEAVQNPAGIPNDRLPGSVAINKTGMNPEDGTTGALNGATFKLEVKSGQEWKMIAEGLKTGNTYEMAYGEDDAYQFSDAGKPDTNGRITVTNLIWGTYRFVETATTDGHINPTDADVSGEIVVGRYTLNPATTGDNQATTIENKPTKLEIIKVGPDGTTKLQGAKFLIEAAPGSSLANGEDDVVIVTNADGAAALEGQLVVGDTYTLTEQQAPNTSYELIDGKVTFTVKDNGELEVQGDLPEGYVKTEGTNNAFSFTVTNSYFELNIQKTGDTQNISGGAAEHPFQGARFTLTGEGYNETLTTDENGRISITSGLKTGVTYTLTETTAPAGFTPAAGSFQFQLDKRGNIVGASGSEAFSADSNTVTITATDVPTSLTITKYNDDQSAKLPDAEFSIKPAADDDAFVDGAEQKTLTTGVNGTTDALVGQLIVGDSYTIEETKAPDGYTKIEGTLTITVQADGSFVIANGTDAPDEFVLSGDKVQVFTGTVTNNPTTMTLIKRDSQTNAPIAGVEFSLAGIFADGTGTTTSRTLTSTTSGVELDKAQLIADGMTVYTLGEVNEPAGYETIASISFTVATDGTIQVQDADTAHAAGWSWASEGIVVTADDDPIEIGLTKVDLGGNAIDNAETAQFVVRPYDANSHFANETAEETVNGITVTTANAEEVLHGRLIADNVYTITETVAPAGYELISDPLTFSVNDDGTIVEQSDPANRWSVGTGTGDESDVAIITAADRPVEIDLVKNGSDNKSNLNGAVFEVYAGEPATGKPVATAPTVNGTLSFDKLTANATYTLREKTAPAGYELMADVVFTVDAHGLVSFKDADAATAAGYSVGEENGVVTITAIDQLIEITLNKKDLGGNALSGAEFTLEGKFSDTQDESKKLPLTDRPYTFSGLIAGEEYTLTETKAPEGYELIADGFTFTVNADGTIKPADGQQTATDGAEGYRIEDGNIAITAQDTPIEAKLKKQSESGKALAGAVFKVTPADDSSFVNKELNASGVTLVASAANGTVDTAALDAQLIAGNSYVIEEVTPPAGYEKITGTLTFAVDADGKISAVANVTNDSAFAIDTANDVMTITATDNPVEVTLNKVGTNSAKLDATFTLKGTFASENMDGTVEAAEPTRTIDVHDGTVTLDRLVVGNTYVLQETTSQAGYEVITGTFTFTVNENGTITPAAEGNDTAYAVTGGNIAIMATNTPVQITVTKVDEQGDNLPGAEFTLTGDMAKADGMIEADHTWTVKPGTDPATIDGLIVTNDENRHEYTLTETTAPAGYEKLGSITFTINRDGTIAGTGVGYTVDGNGINITAQDTAIKARLMKTDENNQPQAGATFAIEPADGSAFADGKTDPVEFTTGEGGVIDLTDAWLVGGNTYTITEVTAPNGYELAGTVTFKVNENGTIDLIDADGKPVAAITETDGSGSYLASADNGVAVITATNSPIAVQMVKQSDGTPLAGATFELTPADGFTFADGSTEAQTITIESTSGATALTNLTANMTYILKETVPPAGYELNETEFTFTVAADGTIVSAEADGYTVSGSEIITITVNDEPIEVTLTKQNADGAALDGAEFTLHGMFANADGTPSGTVADRTVVVENGTVALEGLIADQQYTLTETKAPEGYRVNTGTLTFTVNTDGTLTEVKPAEGYAIDAETGTAIAVTDQPTELDLTKLAADGTPLAGAEFTLAPDTERDADSRFVSDRSSIDLVVGEDGTVPTVTGELIAGHAYVLAETKAPDGYALITEPLHFTVGPKGRAATLTAGTELPKGYTIGGNKEAGTIALTAVDNPIELTLKKVNEDGDVLVGAEFTLSGRFADGTTQQILTTGADGTAALPLIIGGERYVLEETKAPEGYVLPAERYTFTVGVDGVIHVQQNPLAALLPGDKTFSLSEDGLTITVVNEREPVVAITGSDVTSVGFIGFGLLLIGATIAMQRRPRMAQVAGNGKPARGRHRR